MSLSFHSTARMSAWRFYGIWYTKHHVPKIVNIFLQGSLASRKYAKRSGASRR
jgi:hypothetical protein